MSSSKLPVKAYVQKETAAAAAKSLQSCLTLCDRIDGSPPGSPVPGILQVRILEWVAISFSRGPFQPTDGTQLSCIRAVSLLSEPPGKHKYLNVFKFRRVCWDLLSMQNLVLSTL